MFVDYGNIEECKASEMRKNVYMGDIPVQCHKCQLEGIKPVSRNTYWLIYYFVLGNVAYTLTLLLR
jgi:hypothetical protein